MLPRFPQVVMIGLAFAAGMAANAGLRARTAWETHHPPQPQSQIVHTLRFSVDPSLTRHGEEDVGTFRFRDRPGADEAWWAAYEAGRAKALKASCCP